MNEPRLSHDQLVEEVASAHGLDSGDYPAVVPFLTHMASDPGASPETLHALAKDPFCQSKVAANPSAPNELLFLIVTEYRDCGGDDWETETRVAMNANASAATLTSVVQSVLSHPYGSAEQLAEYARGGSFADYDGPWQALVAAQAHTETDDNTRAAAENRLVDAARRRMITGEGFDRQLIGNLLDVLYDHDYPDHDQVEKVRSWLLWLRT